MGSSARGKSAPYGLLALFLLTAGLLDIIVFVNGNFIANITRTKQSADSFYLQDIYCDQKDCGYFNALLTGTNCQCVCHNRIPVYYQHRNACVIDTQENYDLPFKTAHNQEIIVPVAVLPRYGQIVMPEYQLIWQSLGIPFDQSIGDRLCRVQNIRYLTVAGWKSLEQRQAGIFQLTVVSNQTKLRWFGHDHADRSFEGRIIQVALNCTIAGNIPVRVTFRVAGTEVLVKTQSTNSPHSRGQRVPTYKEDDEGTGEPEDEVPLAMIIGIVCGVLLVMTCLTMAVVYNMCWKRKKDRLIKRMQMEYIMHQRSQENSRIAAQANAHFAQEAFVPSTIESYQYQMYTSGGPIPNGSLPWGENPYRQNYPPDFPGQQGYPEPDQTDLTDSATPSGFRSDFVPMRNIGQPYQYRTTNPTPNYNQLSLPALRKKLYFSPEFLEPDLMVDPPPVAKEFLSEVRQMIDLAKNRIRSRRHIPSLLVIPEDDRSYDSRKTTRSQGQENSGFIVEEVDGQESPKSTLSTSPDHSPNSSPGGQAQTNDRIGPSSSSTSNGTSVDSGVSITNPFGEPTNGFLTPEEWNINGNDKNPHSKVTSWLNGFPKPSENGTNLDNGTDILTLRVDDIQGSHKPSSSVPPSCPPEAALKFQKGATSPAGLPVSYGLLRRYGLLSFDGTSRPPINGHVVMNGYSHKDDPYILPSGSNNSGSFPRLHQKPPMVMNNYKSHLKFVFSPQNVP